MPRPLGLEASARAVESHTQKLKFVSNAMLARLVRIGNFAATELKKRGVRAL